MLHYDKIRPYFEQGGRDAKSRNAFGKRIEAYSEGRPFDLKPIIRQAIGFFGQFMDVVRSSMTQQVDASELFIEHLIERFKLVHPDVCIRSLSAMPVDDEHIVENAIDIVQIFDEFIVRAREMRKYNNGQVLKSMEKRLITNR